MAQCKALTYSCKTCGERFSKGESFKICPKCGTDRHCKANAVRGYNYCGMHGAPNPGRNYWGMGRPMTNGKDSGFAMTRLASKYEEMMRNGRVLSNRHSIEIIRDRIMQLFGRLDQNDAPDRLIVLEKLWEKYKAEKDSGLGVEAVITAAKIDQAFEAARTDFATWNQMIQLLDMDRKMVESEVKIAKEIKAIMTAEEAGEMVAKLMASIFSAVGSMDTISIHDKGIILKRIQYEFSRITGDFDDATVEAGVVTSQPETIDI